MTDNRKAAPARAALRESSIHSQPDRTPSLFDQDGRVLRDQGAELAENAVHTSWRLAAEATIAELAASGVEFTSDDLHQLIGPPPGHASAVGAVFLAAQRRKEIRAVGFKITNRPEAHARPIRVWRAAA